MTWPVAPLLALPGVTDRVICRAIHVSARTWRTLRDQGMTDWQADRAAIRLGYHPASIWPGWVAAGLTPLDEQFLAAGWRQAWLWKEPA